MSTSLVPSPQALRRAAALIGDSRAALFDMDGTLVDSTLAVESVWARFAEEHSVDVADVLAVAHGVRAPDTIARYLPGLDVLAASALHEQRELELLEGVVEVPGAAELLQVLGLWNFPTAVVTSASERLARARMGAAGVTVPETLIHADSVPRGKPAPDGYLVAADRLGIPIEDCVVFEDAEAGIRSAVTSGARVIVVGEWRSPSTLALERIPDYDYEA